MYAKIFGQIFDSSIAADYVVRHVFMDLLVLADRDGVVDMTLDAIARRTNVPDAIVSHAIEELMKPDERSRSHIEDGRRLILLDSHRNWGWQIVNYDHYRTIRDEESRKAYFRDYKRQYRQKSKLSTPSPTLSTLVLDSPTLSTKAEAEADVEEKEKPSAFVDSWNRLSGALPKVEKFTESRRKKVQARIRQGVSSERFSEAVLACSKKPFLCGDNDRGWIATFDWLIENDKNIEKAINNPYGLNGHKPKDIYQKFLEEAEV